MIPLTNAAVDEGTVPVGTVCRSEEQAADQDARARLQQAAKILAKGILRAHAGAKAQGAAEMSGNVSRIAKGELGA